MNSPRIASLLAAPLIAVMATPVFAQQPKADIAYANPTFANPDTPGLMMGQPGADVPNTTDIVFLKQLALGGRAEVELGKLAQQRSKTTGVDEFGNHMVKDHSTANGKLAALAKSAQVELPAALDAEHESLRKELAALDGTDFDLRYVGSQIADHQKAVELLIYEIGGGQHAGTREFAAATLPTVMAHLESAQALHATLTKQPPPR